MHAIIGWGSLIWNPDGLPHDGRWRADGPTLPIEFSRISTDGRLTLIIDLDHGVDVDAGWTASPRERIVHVVEDVARREACPPEQIGFVERATGRGSSHVLVERFAEWCAARDLDGAVWTALPRTFDEFSVPNALDYLHSLAGELRDRSLAYVRNAPELIDTPVRRAFDADPRFR